MFRRVIFLLLLAPLAAPAGEPADPAAARRCRELIREYEKVKRSPLWEKVKERRRILEELRDLGDPAALRVLYTAFTKDREQICRIPAMIGLAKMGNLKVLKTLVRICLREHNDIYRLCLPLALGEAADPRIGPWLTKNLLPERKDRDLRAAVIQSLGLLGTKEAFEPIRKILEKERRHPRIVYESLLALGRIGGKEAIPVIAPYLENPDGVLREGAVLALAETGDPGVVARVLPLASDVSPRVQESVAETVGRYRAEPGIPALIGLLRSGRLRVMDTARRTLEAITGEKFGFDADAWELWLARKKAGKLPEKPVAGRNGSVATYYGLKILSDRVLFIVDHSGSMDAGKPPRIETARKELKKTLEELNPRTLFNIVGFGSGTTWWKDSEVKATKKNVAEALRFVDRLSVGGGTNVWDTLVEALEKNRLIDTIYFLGDGSPSLGRYTEQDEILIRFRWLNRFRKVRVNCIALLRGKVGRFGGRMGPGLGRGRSISPDRMYDEEEAARFLARLAAENGGTFVKVDK